eukprot:8941896-Ditylum_brightwellii.AAC.1
MVTMVSKMVMTIMLKMVLMMVLTVLTSTSHIFYKGLIVIWHGEESKTSMLLTIKTMMLFDGVEDGVDNGVHNNVVDDVNNIVDDSDVGADKSFTHLLQVI